MPTLTQADHNTLIDLIISDEFIDARHKVEMIKIVRAGFVTADSNIASGRFQYHRFDKLCTASAASAVAASPPATHT